jgi:hypothetical protein
VGLDCWDETAIAERLQRMSSEEPKVITHYISSVRDRWVLHQDDRTAGVRLRFLKSQIEQLKLGREIQQIRDDIDLLLLEREKRIKTLQLEVREVDLKKHMGSQLDDLAVLRERKKIELDIAELDEQIYRRRNPSTPEPQLTPEEQKAKDKAACEAKIATLKQEKQNALKITDEAERMLRINAIDDAIQREMERWAKLL